MLNMEGLKFVVTIPKAKSHKLQKVFITLTFSILLHLSTTQNEVLQNQLGFEENQYNSDVRNEKNEETSPNSQPNFELKTQKTTLTFHNFVGTNSDNYINLLEEINARFTAEYPDLEIVMTTLNLDAYSETLITNIIAGNAPDIFLVLPSIDFYSLADVNYLMPFTEEAWVDSLFTNAKNRATYNGKVYGLPIGFNAIGVIYNKNIFTQLDLNIPTTWDEFKNVVQIIKATGIVPLVAGFKDAWVTQLIPYAMSPTAIYKAEVDFDLQMYQLEKTFAGSAWEQMMTDYIWMQDNNYFQESALDTDAHTSVDIMVTGEAAMIVQGSWIINSLRTKAPDIELGMFPFPYSDDGVNHIATGIEVIMASSATTEHPEAVRAYIEFFAKPETMTFFLEQKGTFPTFKNLTPDLGEELNSLLPYLSTGTHSFPDRNWPPNVHNVMMKSIEEVLAGNLDIATMLQDMDRAFFEGLVTQKDIPNRLSNPEF